MAAAPFIGNLEFTGLGNGAKIMRYFTASDVTTQAYTFSDSQTSLTLPADQNYALTDLTLSAAGTDTKQATIYVGGAAIPVVIVNAANLATNVSRQFKSAPLGLKAGSNIKIVQIT